jgi:hypothetical protein
VTTRGPRIDKRLIGTWRSDRTRTLRTYRPKPGAPSKAVRQFKGLFGKMVVQWGRGVFRSDLDGFRTVEKYTVVAADSTSVVVKMPGPLGPERQLQQIHFEGEYYWVALGGGLCEYFRRVPRARPNQAMQRTRCKAKRSKTKSKATSR